MVQGAILHVTTAYGWIIAIIAAVLGGLVTLTMIDKADAALWPERARRVASGAVGGLVSLCAARMAYVVWRDIDIACSRSASSTALLRACHPSSRAL